MITLNHLGILQWVRTLAAGCFSLNAAGIVLLIFAPSHAQSAPRSDFQAPISSSECRERLRIFGASDAGIELATRAIEGYVKLVLQQTPSEDTAVIFPFLMSPLELSAATQFQNRIERQLAECDAADAQLTSGINSAMRSDSDQQAAQRFHDWVNLRRDKLFLATAGIDIKPLDFSAENALAKIDKDGSIRLSLRSQFAAQSESIVRLSRSARNAIVENPIRTARLAMARSVAPSINPAELNDSIKAVENAGKNAVENLELLHSAFEDWKQSVEQVRTDGIRSASGVFEKIGEIQKSFVEQFAAHANAEAGWDVWMVFYNRAYPLSMWDRRSTEESAKTLRKVSGVTAESLATLSTFEKKWHAESLTLLAAAAKRYDESCWDRHPRGINFADSSENEFRKKLIAVTDSFQNQIATLTVQSPTYKKTDSPQVVAMSPESIAMEMEMTFGTLCSVTPMNKGDMGNILDATEATPDQRTLALVIQQDLSESLIRSTDDVSKQWTEVGVGMAPSPEKQQGTPSVADIQEIARIRQEQLRADRMDSDQFFSQVSAILSTAPKASLLESYRLIHLRNIERNLIKCMLEQVQGISIEPLWRVDFESIALATHIVDSQPKTQDSLRAIIQANNQAILPPMRRLSDALIALHAGNQMMFASDQIHSTATIHFNGRSIAEDEKNPRELSDSEVYTNQRDAELLRCFDESKHITSIQNATLAQILSTLPPKDARGFQNVFRRTAYPSLAKFLGAGDLWIILALALTERDESNNQPANEQMAQSIIELASPYGRASEALFLTAVEQQSIIDAADIREQPAKEILRHTLFARKELDAGLHRDLERVLGPELALKLNQKPGGKNK
jgi:hypothetical protein